ncbi:5-oxoprolinase subunit PxpB [Pseudotamlana carrageenivorans]|uniref:Allophanate hydrolase subunit 1 n=1 Tax=Pseudotamlana carrageenivorans TaxID=2069432 RepID=A0A2I7SDR0_9FLAO|nr:5-oxoprolinase subunit PxpB [Tamlana carrageenivorans]AUS04026.1 allophanate hydrolase subunit 1 [Tamlana carrageenivorans]
MSFKLSYKPFGEQGILVEWPNQISESILENVLGFKSKIRIAEDADIAEVRTAYQSVLILFHTPINFQQKIEGLKRVYASAEKEEKRTSQLWRIPVCYDDCFALDLEHLSAVKNISKSEIIKRHIQATYTVYFIGFLPGFLYLGGLDDTLSMPRKSTPRLVIEKGAVAIGGNQIGVYPSESPGGWNIIGKSPIPFFNENLNPPCFAVPGDRIEFYAVNLKEFNDIKVLVDAGVYQIESEVTSD